MVRFGLVALFLGLVQVALACETATTPPANQAGGNGGAAGSGTGAGNGGDGGTGAGGGAGQGGTAGSGAGAGGGTAGSGAGTGGGASGAGGGTAGSGGAGGGTDAGTGLPEGNTGIATKHPNDVGIETDPAVIFADGFEDASLASDLGKKWDAVYQNQQIRIATEPGNIFGGKKALEFTVPQQTAELSNATDKIVSPERDVLFLRYYSKFQAPFDVVGSSHNGSMISAHYFINGQATPGVPADGKNKFLANLEDWRGEVATASPGPLNIYIYHPEQRSQWGDHFFPTGSVLPNTSVPFDFGPSFKSRPDVTPALDRWYCYEYMLQANTPGQRNGRIAFWLDGKLLADFMNLRLRDVDTLKIDRFGLSFHIGSNPNGATKKWYDNVVAATSYVGPVFMP
jgi:hypothetical protein